MILSFTGKYSFLSNFYPSPVQLDGYTFPTVEHAYQAAKTSSAAERALIACCKTPGSAKRCGRKVTIRADWDNVKISIMLNLLKQKFNYAHLAKQLLETGTEELIEGNYWGDKFWGVDEKTRIGHNWLGRLLMQVRTEINLVYIPPIQRRF